jgi:hypothetical protein
MAKENCFKNKSESLCSAKLTRIAVVLVWFLQGAALKDFVDFFYSSLGPE